ncbi:SOG2 [Sanghuangporus sanghuang]
MVQQFRASETRASRSTESLMAVASDSERAMGRVSPQAYSSGRVSPPASGVLTKALILDAIARSIDDGCTLDLSNKNLVDVGEAGAEELAQVGRGEDLLDECRILRIALVGNYLSSLPMSFACITRLRYLTLRSNSFTVLPEVLTVMPSLEILDLSRNKIRGLPTNPGTLVNLRVISLSRNKIRRLPSYLWKCKNLTVVKADHNPIEWPPREIMEPEDDLEDADVMHSWVETLKSWIAENGVDEEKTTLPLETQSGTGSAVKSVPDHARNASVDSERSIYSTSSYENSVKGSKRDSPPPIDTASTSPSIAEGISASPESYLPTPEDSLPFVDDDTARPSSHPAHGRNRSYAPGGEVRKRGLSVQKSLPDLRVASRQLPFASKARLRTPSVDGLKKSPNEGSAPTAESSTQGVQASARPRPPRLPRHEPLPSISERKVPSMDFERNSYFRRYSSLPVAVISKMTPPALLSVIDCVRGILFAVTQVYQSLQHYTVHCIDERLSAVLLKVLVPASSCLMQLITALDKFDSMSKRGCPPPFVCRAVIESCKDNVAMFGKAVGVLSMQLKVFASREDVRYSRQMLLVLYGATAEISNSWQGIVPHLESIEALLRDDQPSPSSTAVMITPAPPRMSPFKSHLPPQASSSRVVFPPIAEQPEPPLASSQMDDRTGSPSVSAQSVQSDVSIPTATSPMRRAVPSEGRSRVNRRHAGSFSVKDVEIGRSLPSNAELSPPAGGLASGATTPTPRAYTGPIRRDASSGSPVPPLPNSIPSLSQSQPSPGMHSRQNSGQNATVGTAQLSLPGPSKGQPDAPTSSGALVDKEALDAMGAAVRAASAVWATLEEIANDMAGIPIDIHSTLAKAQSVTRRLGDTIRATQEGHLNADRKALREDAHVFIRTVVTLSKFVKDYSAAHRLSGQLRSDMAKLTNATQGFVMLLHVSSFAPSTPRPYSPSVNASQITITTIGSTNSGGSQSPIVASSNGSGTEEKSQQSASSATLGRSRSAQPSASSKLVPPNSSGPAPRSAQPHQQNFKVPATPRANGASKLRNGDLAPSMDAGLVIDTHTHGNGL